MQFLMYGDGEVQENPTTPDILCWGGGVLSAIVSLSWRPPQLVTPRVSSSLRGYHCTAALQAQAAFDSVTIGECMRRDTVQSRVCDLANVCRQGISGPHEVCTNIVQLGLAPWELWTPAIPLPSCTKLTFCCRLRQNRRSRLSGAQDGLRTSGAQNGLSGRASWHPRASGQASWRPRRF